MALAISFDSPNFMVLRWTFAFWNSHVSFFIQPFRHFREAIPAIAVGIANPAEIRKTNFRLFSLFRECDSL